MGFTLAHLLLIRHVLLADSGHLPKTVTVRGFGGVSVLAAEVNFSSARAQTFSVL